MMSEDFYAAWHRDLGNAEYRIKITMAGYGTDPADGERFLEGFLEKYPESGPVVSQNSVDDTISVTFGVTAPDRTRASELAELVWVGGGTASGLEPTSVVRLEIEAVQASAEAGELLQHA